MAIASKADYIAALKERPTLFKTAARAGAAGKWMTLWDGSGTPAAGTLAVGNTAAGVVPTDATTGAPVINYVAGVAYLTASDAWASAGARAVVYDRLFHAGAYAFNAAVTLASQPVYSSRIVGSDYTGLQLWIECVTSFTGNLSVAVTYTDQNGNTGHTTGTVALGVAPTIGQMIQLPLAAGDCGLQKIESVTATVAAAGTFNVLVLRPLWTGYFFYDAASNVIQATTRKWLDRTGMPRVWLDSCLAAMMQTDGATTPSFDIALELASNPVPPFEVTWNPLDKGNAATLSNGDLSASGTTGGTGAGINCTAAHGVTGKYYWECKVLAVDGLNHLPSFGLARIGGDNLNGSFYGNPGGIRGWGINQGGSLAVNGVFAGSVTGYTTNDVIGFAVDFAAGKFWIAVNNVWESSGNPAAGTNPLFTGLNDGNLWCAACGCSSASFAGTVVAVTAHFAATSWTYAAPSGFGAL